MVNLLRRYHPNLFQRLTTKAVVFSALGVSLIEGPTTTSPSAARSILHYLLPLQIWGDVFLAIGLLIALGLIMDGQKFRFLRSVVILATGIASIWFIALAIIAFQTHGSFSVDILWGYLTANLFFIGTDNAWDTSKIVDELRKKGAKI